MSKKQKKEKTIKAAIVETGLTASLSGEQHEKIRWAEAGGVQVEAGITLGVPPREGSVLDHARHCCQYAKSTDRQRAGMLKTSLVVLKKHIQDYIQDHIQDEECLAAVALRRAYRDVFWFCNPENRPRYLDHTALLKASKRCD